MHWHDHESRRLTYQWCEGGDRKLRGIGFHEDRRLRFERPDWSFCYGAGTPCAYGPSLSALRRRAFFGDKWKHGETIHELDVDFGRYSVERAFNVTSVSVKTVKREPVSASLFAQVSNGFWKGRSDASGHAAIPMKEGASIEFVRVTASGYRVILVPGPKETNPKSMVCVCSEPGTDVVLRLESGGQPLADAAISLTGVFGIRQDFLESRVTDIRGECELRSVPTTLSKYSLGASDANGRSGAGKWRHDEFWKAADQGASLNIDLHSRRDLLVRTLRHGDREPIAGANVWIFEGNGTYQVPVTDADGLACSRAS